MWLSSLSFKLPVRMISHEQQTGLAILCLCKNDSLHVILGKRLTRQCSLARHCSYIDIYNVKISCRTQIIKFFINTHVIFLSVLVEKLDQLF